jgi:hypothetical protein
MAIGSGLRMLSLRELWWWWPQRSNLLTPSPHHRGHIYLELWEQYLKFLPVPACMGYVHGVYNEGEGLRAREAD